MVDSPRKAERGDYLFFPQNQHVELVVNSDVLRITTRA